MELHMVDPIKGSGDKIIITKPKPKEKTEKPREESFDKVMSDRDKPGSASSKPVQARSKADANLAILDQQNLARMQKLETLAKAVRAGTYKLADADVVADKILSIILDKKTRDKFTKKILTEEIENYRLSKDKLISDLDLKKLIHMIKNREDAKFDDPELEAMLKEFS